jgi:hypothetical protein
VVPNLVREVARQEGITGGLRPFKPFLDNELAAQGHVGLADLGVRSGIGHAMSCRGALKVDGQPIPGDCRNARRQSRAWVDR